MVGETVINNTTNVKSDVVKKSTIFMILGIFAIVAIAFTAGFYFDKFYTNSYMAPNVKDYNGSIFSGKDTNFMLQLAYSAGFCERVGLVSTVKVGYDPDLNRYFGTPICIQPTK